LGICTLKYVRIIISRLINLGDMMKNNLRKLVGLQMKLSALHRYHIHSVLSKHGVFPGQPPLLAILEECDCTQKELSEKLNVSAATVAVSVKRLQKSGFVEKLSDSEDLRCNRIRITKKGKEISELCRSECDRIDNKMFEGFSDEEKAQYKNFLERLSYNLSGDSFTKRDLLEFFEKEGKE